MSTEREKLEQAMAALEAQRAILGDMVVDAALAPMREKLTALRQAARAPAAEFRGERKLVTVMFADISGFTALSETLDPETVRDLMNACFETLVPIVENYGGTVDKFIGDEIMALFGAPVAHENDAERALRAALEMRDVIRAWGRGVGEENRAKRMENSEQEKEPALFSSPHSSPFSLHFGINTGFVIAGGLGPHERQEYTVMGDTVNVAARLEGLSEQGEILVGPDTYRLTAPLFDFKSLGPVHVKGKAEPVPVYRLLVAKAVPGKVRGIAGLASPLVGRQVELQLLQDAIARLRQGTGGIVTLIGEAGLGKSRLVAELRTGEKRECENENKNKERGAESGDVEIETHISRITPHASRTTLYLEGRCLSYGSSIAYLLWLDILRGLLDVKADAAPSAVRNALRERIQALCPDCFDAVFPYLARLMSLPLEVHEEAMMNDLTGEQLKSGTFEAVETLVEHAARRQPLVIICEDLHWADPTSLDLLESLFPLVNRVPLLFVCLFRPEREHGCWQTREVIIRDYAHCHTDVWLAPLSATESQTLVSNLLYVEGLPPKLRERILNHAEGNPFYVEEIVRSLMDDGTIARDEETGSWKATRNVADIAIPDTLHGVLMARIDRLQEETKHVLQLASVIGRLFFYRVLAEIAQETRQLDDHLLTLRQEEMIRERARVPELEYIFKHQLTQEAAYNSLLKKEQRVFHRQVAEALEHLFPERVEEQVGLLAYHWEHAEEAEKATEYLLRAGDQARLAYAHVEAIDYYQRALVFLRAREEHERAARTLMKLGLTYHTAFDFQRSRQAYEEGFVLWKRAGEAREVGTLPPAPHAYRGVWGDPVTLDPTLANDSTSIDVIDQLFSGLVILDADTNVVPDVARSWEVLEGGRRFIFHLRDDVVWSDGTPVSADDFDYAWKRALDPAIGSPSASLLYDIKGARAFHQGVVGRDAVGIQAQDTSTLIVDLEAPTGYFLHLLAQSACYPVPKHLVEARGEAWVEAEHIVTNGAFRLETWQLGNTLVLVRNPTYHGRALLRGNVERVVLFLQDLDSSARLTLYEADRLDILRLPPLEMEQARQRHAGEYVSFPLLSTEYVGFNTTRQPFDDPRVRQAFVRAVDRETLADVIFRGGIAPATGGFVSPGTPGHSPGIGLPYDPEGARRLLAEAGYPEGRGFPEISAWARTGSEFYDEYLRAQWRDELGVEIQWEMLDWGKYLAKLQEGFPQLFVMGWIADYPDPDNFLRVGLQRERSVWHNETYDRWVEQARRMTDQEERMKLYAQADALLVQQAVIMPLYHQRLHRLVKPWISEPPPLVIGGPRWKDVIIKPHP